MYHLFPAGQFLGVFGATHLDFIHISNPSPGLSKSLLESLNVGQVNRDVFCFTDYSLECGWWMFLPKVGKKRCSV